MKYLFTLCFSFVLFTSSHAQPKDSLTVTGQVTDEEGEPLEYVSICEKGKNSGTNTDKRGMYTITVSSPKVVLQFARLNYQTQKVRVRGRKAINVEMVIDIVDSYEVF
jgi:hypothetical protein